jgi:Zn-dependent protease with chaperone function
VADELKREAHELGLRLKVEFVPGDFSVRPPVLPAISPKFEGAVRMPESYLSFLTRDELRCAFLHEAAHVKLRHFPKDVAFAVALLLPSFLLGLWSTVFFLPVLLGVAALTLLVLERRFEFQADMFAAERVSVRAMIGLLRKLRERYGDCPSLSHPSLERRILGLKRKNSEAEG